MLPAPPPQRIVQTANKILRTLAVTPDNEVFRRLLRQIKQDGYACTAVIPDLSRQSRGWTYTVGLCLHRLPELVIAHMPGQQAITYLDHATAVQRSGTAWEHGDDVTMHDGSVWTARRHDPRASLYGLRHTMRLFGDAHQVRALRLMPPPTLQWPPGASWEGYACRCGAHTAAEPC